MRKNKIQLTITEKEVLKILKSRWKKGRKEYGEGIEYNSPNQTQTVIGWIDNAIEEAADMLQYLVALKLKVLNDKRYNK